VFGTLNKARELIFFLMNRLLPQLHAKKKIKVKVHRRRPAAAAEVQKTADSDKIS
jgi:hypothetical protein